MHVCGRLISLIPTIAAASGSTFWFPPGATTSTGMVDWIFYFIFWIGLFFFVLIVSLMVGFLIAFRRRAGVAPQKSPTENKLLEVTWTAIPVALLAITFGMGLKGYMELNTPPEDAYEINVTAQQWAWMFTYPNGYTDENLHVPLNTNVVLTMTSEDVIHGFFVPSFRIKRDVVPGRYAKVWFNAQVPGKYDIFCSQYCGRGHSTMHSYLIVQRPEDYAKWLDNAQNSLLKASPAEAGSRIFHTRGCTQCHSLDGTVIVGPSLKDVYGTIQPLQGGKTILADDNYIRQHVLTPGNTVVRGFTSDMPSFKGRLNDREITALIAFLKTQSKAGGKP